MKKFIEFFKVFRAYRKTHSPMYAARLAFDIAYRGLPF